MKAVNGLTHVALTCARAAAAADDIVPLPFWKGSVSITVYQLCLDGPSAELSSGDDSNEGDEGIANYTQWELPNVAFEGTWESLVYDTPIKET